MTKITFLGILALCIVTACEEGELLYQIPIVDGGPADLPDAETPADADVVAADADVSVPTEPIYIHTSDTLYSYDPVENRAQRIGLFRDSNGPLKGMVDIAIDRDGRMFGGSSEWLKETKINRVYRIDPNTAEVRFQFEHDDALNGLAFLPDGKMITAGERVDIVDPDSGYRLRTLVAKGQPFQTSGDIVGLPDGFLYWTVKGADGDRQDRVVRLDPDSGEVKFLAKTNLEAIFGLGYAGETLFGFARNGTVLEVDPEDGRIVSEQQLSGDWWGATTNPVVWEE